MLLVSRRPGRLPIVPAPETDELMSSWLKRIAAAYRTKPGALLQQLGTIQTDPATFDWMARPSDIDLVAAALGTDKSDLVRRSFVGIPKSGLMFVSLGTPAKSCPSCSAEFTRRGLSSVVLFRWKLSVAQECRRCGGRLSTALHSRSKSPHSPLLTGHDDEILDDVLNVLAMAMYDHTEAPVVERLFRAVSTPVLWPTARRAAPPGSAMKNGPAFMWRAWNHGKTGIERAAPVRLNNRNFAAWPENAQMIAAAAIKQLACGPAEIWSDLRRLGLIEIGDTTVGRRLFRA